MSWVSVHAFHHGDLDVLLLRGARPLVEHLRRRGLVDGFFFLRYWDGGPHLRLRLRATTAPALVEAVALRWLRHYLTEHPAPAAPDDLAGYPAYAAALARAEGMAEFLPKPLPNNTAHAIAYRPETGRYGDGPALDAVERHFVESSRIALGLIAAGTDRNQRHTVALSALLLTASAFARTPNPLPVPPLPPLPPLKRGTPTPQPASTATPTHHHPPTPPTPPLKRGRPTPQPASTGTPTAPAAGGEASALLIGGGIEADFEAGYAASRERVRALVARVAAIADGTSMVPPGSLAAWWRSMCLLRERLGAAGQDPDRAWRVADTCAHLLCNRLGLGLTEEAYARFLAGRAGVAA